MGLDWDACMQWLKILFLERFKLCMIVFGALLAVQSASAGNWNTKSSSQSISDGKIPIFGNSNIEVVPNFKILTDVDRNDYKYCSESNLDRTGRPIKHLGYFKSKYRTYFEKNYSQFLEYRFVGLFPLNLNSTRVQYGNSQVLKATASFSYDRYICGESSSLARDLGRAFNDIGAAFGNSAKDGDASYGDNDRLNRIMRVGSRSSTILNSDTASLLTSPTGSVTSGSQVSALGGNVVGFGNQISG